MTIVIPGHLRAAQLKASDPGLSVWVSANAGSGKTHVLTQRVIRLLLRGVPPAKILCLTFTKAAAAQMATRVFQTLARWTDLDDASLRAAVMETGAPAPSRGDLLLARRLFTRAVETPGGLKIQTIHAFCERVLHLFPFEANVPARFEVADDARQAMLLASAKRESIARAHRDAGPLGAALARIGADANSAAIDALIGEAMNARAPARRFGGADPQESLPRRLGWTTRETATSPPPSARGGGEETSLDSVAAIEWAMLEGGIAPATWPELAAFLDTGSSSDVERGAKLRLAHDRRASADAIPGQALEAYLSVFLTTAGEPAKRLLTAALSKKRPGLADTLVAEQARLIALIERRKIAETLERTNALITLADTALDLYAERKILVGVLDFNDLVERTRALLDRSDAGWVLHKLDAGIDHVLVDEAQDTSEAQWRILDDLTGDFAAGFGAGGAERSFFAVGDDKQSIFSFQGAAPHKFHEMRQAFARRFSLGQKAFEHVRLKASFRSVPGVLAAVDRVFDVAAHQAGLVPPGDIWPMHESIKARLPGLVEIWPPVGKREGEEPGDWRIPLDVADERDPTAILATRIAKTIAALVAPGSGEWVHDGHGAAPRPIRPGDVLILVRRRNAFFEAIIRALKQASVPVAGADRLDIANHIAVLDLAAAGRAALLPQDDLTLACLLKSPLFGFTDDDLLALAPAREGALIDALATSPDPRHGDAREKILRWSRHAADVTPFAFYVDLLGRDGGRRLMEARLGPEAHDAIDEFLRLALAHERDGAPSLCAFLADILTPRGSIKRDMEGPGDAVRVMTVHAAKGLEAKIVFLPDTCGVPSLQHEPKILNLETDDDKPPILAWSPRKDGDCPEVAAARAAARAATMDEYRRLLYVAMTRAEERLYIAGFHGAREPDPQCWTAMIATAFSGDPDIVEAAAPWDASETILRRVTPGHAGALPSATPADDGAPSPAAPGHGAPARSPEAAAPAWLFRPAIIDGTWRSVHPSGLAAAPGVAATGAVGTGLAHGSAIHGLLQYLPDVPVARREASALAFLAADPRLPPESHRTILDQALAVLALPALAPLFAPGSRAEVAVLGDLARRDGSIREIRARVDRLAVAGDTVWIADYKSGEPRGARDTPPSYVRQMGLYARALAPLWPGKAMRALLVWTAGPLVVELDARALDRAAAEVLDENAPAAPA